MAERDLAKLLSSLSVTRRDGVWRFETITAGQASWSDLVSLKDVRNIAMMFQETEGMTVITAASDNTPEENQWVWLQLNVYSDLQAVGFLAEVATALAQVGIPCNAVAAYHHDHIFVPVDRVSEAIAAIETLRAKT